VDQEQARGREINTDEVLAGFDRTAVRTGRGSDILFFNARGDLLERSLEGMYRQLLHQLLTKVARLHSIFPASDISDLDPLDWPRQLLENQFKKCVLGLGGQEGVTCFIDALDECPESEIRDLVEFFEDLGEFTATKGIRFRVCFSSRHYPNVSLEKCQHFMLDGQSGHQQDIAAYIDNKLRLPTSKVNEEIKSDVRDRAQGVFLWVVLVVKKLKRDIDRGVVKHLRSRLDEAPDGLDALFRDALRITDDNDGMMMNLMQWMLYARQSLTREELYFGVHSPIDGDLEPWDHDEITSEVMDRFIVNCSRGLVESTREQYPRMQFIHESVRDYLFGGGLGLLAPAISNNLAGVSHDYLKRSCLQVLTSSTIDDVWLRTHTLENPFSQAHQDPGYDPMRPIPFPLLDYAWVNVVGHAELASQHGVNQDEFIASFPLQVWNQMKQTRGVSVSYKPANSKTEMLINADAYGLLEHELRPGYPLLMPAEHVRVIRMALKRSKWDLKFQERDVLKIVLKRGVVADISNDDQASLFRLAVSEPAYYQDPCLLDLLSPLFNGGMRLHSDELFRSVLSQALLHQNLFIQDLLNHEAHFGPFTTDPLHNAVNRGSIAAVKTLLDGGADFNACMMATASSRTIHGGCVDSFLDVSCHDAYLRLASCLKRANMDAFSFSRGTYEDLAEHLTAFQYAALIGREDIICLFLAHAADPYAVPNEYHEFEIPMYFAALLGHHAIVSQLLKDARWVTYPHSGIWQRALRAAAHAGHNETLKILLADHPHMQARGAPPPPPSAYKFRQLPPGGCVSLASYEEDMLARGILPVYFEEAINETVRFGREETLMILLDFLDASSPLFCSRGRRTLCNALWRAEDGRSDGLARILRERGATRDERGVT
jgi:hypothetical protein